MYLDRLLELAFEKNNLRVAMIINVLKELFNMAYDEDCDTVILAKQHYSKVEIGIPKIPDMYQLGTDYNYQAVQAALRNFRDFTQRVGYEVDWEEPIMQVLTTHDLNCASLRVCKFRLEIMLTHMIAEY